MIKIIIIPYRTFKERIKLVSKYLGQGFKVEVEEDYLVCTGKSRGWED